MQKSFLFLLVVTGLSAFAQEPRQIVLPPGTVYGSLHPELIPDTVACRLFFAAIAERRPFTTGASASLATGAPALTPRQRAKVVSVGLSDGDESALADVLADFSEAVDKLMSAANSQESTNKTPVSQTESLDEIAERTIAQLHSRMTVDGFERLLAHIRSEKTKMKRMPYPDMSGHSH
jgi:hypothetical protein